MYKVKVAADCTWKGLDCDAYNQLRSCTNMHLDELAPMECTGHGKQPHSRRVYFTGIRTESIKLKKFNESGTVSSIPFYTNQSSRNLPFMFLAWPL
jgi:hypothetical protein